MRDYPFNNFYVNFIAIQIKTNIFQGLDQEITHAFIYI